MTDPNANMMRDTGSRYRHVARSVTDRFSDGASFPLFTTCARCTALLHRRRSGSSSHASGTCTRDGFFGAPLYVAAILQKRLFVTSQTLSTFSVGGFLFGGGLGLKLVTCSTLVQFPCLAASRLVTCVQGPVSHADVARRLQYDFTTISL